MKQLKKIDVITTTISGSTKDWKKVYRLEGEFENYYPGSSEVHIVDSHKQARDTACEVVKSGGRIIVSAGGGGTFNNILEGTVENGVPEGMRLAFLRKGSADLIGKVLNIPDSLEEAVKIISDSIVNDNIIDADIIEITTKDKNGKLSKRHMIGFGGVGIFGDVPYFTEGRFVKYCKGITGTLLGDLGPFKVGVLGALLKHYIEKMTLRGMEFNIKIDDKILLDKFATILILNGDLKEDFPLAKGIPLGGGDFLAVGLKDKGITNSIRQLIHSLKGDIYDYSEELGVRPFMVKELTIIPDRDRWYLVNVDGLRLFVKGEVKYSIIGKVKLITG